MVKRTVLLICNIVLVALLAVYAVGACWSLAASAHARPGPGPIPTPTALPTSTGLDAPGAPRNIRIFSDERATWVSWEQVSEANRVLVYRCVPCSLLIEFPSAPGMQGISIWPPQRGITIILGEFVTGEPGGLRILGFYELGSVPYRAWLPGVWR